MTMVQTTTEHVLELLREPPEVPDTSAGYLDLLGRSSKPSLAQSVMESTFLPRIYEKVWRPIGFNVAKGWPFGPDTAAEHALARDWLGLTARPRRCWTYARNVQHRRGRWSGMHHHRSHCVR
ncbi:hypothetical protein [Actinomadura sp. BRA 177]|uniref:hypothetical protein n=1 Tax=Actinomadura sp. BRA 177 TaxID=2745202 RepID=UPI001595E212|nr:hypothetical protein [Actinomadura sp. BRA 177]NVI87046.1 hypothetical protein [Actinomadura sp. BRA 177]